MKGNAEQLNFPFSDFQRQRPNDPLFTPTINSYANRVDLKDEPFHDWYRFVLSFPPHLVRHYINDFGLDDRHTLLDPFCGTGTTLVEAKLNGLNALGVEANPFAHFASSVKVDWSVDADVLTAASQEIADLALNKLKEQGISDIGIYEGNVENHSLRKLEPDATKLLLTNSMSPLPLHKTLVLLDCLNRHRNQSY